MIRHIFFYLIIIFTFARYFFLVVGEILERYIVYYKGLKAGSHHFEFEIDGLLFHRYQSKDILDGNLHVSIELIKHSTMLELEVKIEGDVEVICDRCLEPFRITVDFEGKLIVKIVSEGLQPEKDDELWIVNDKEYELSLAHYFYESICLSLPIKRYHGINGSNTSDCDPAMLQLIVNDENIEITNDEEVEGDPRWEMLKKIKNNLKNQSS